MCFSSMPLPVGGGRGRRRARRPVVILDCGSGVVAGCTRIRCIPSLRCARGGSCRGEPAHGDTLAVRAYDHVQLGLGAALSSHGDYEDDVHVRKVFVRG